MTRDKQPESAAPVRRNAIVFAGPTASGKSAAALAAAREFGGTVINADSMQVYRELAVLTARPDAAAMAAVPHKLYGVIPAGEACSAARWRALALAEIDAALAAGRLPIIAGGTGLYIEALAKGLAPVPEIPPEVRDEARRLIAEEGAALFHARLARLDPEAAAAVRPSDRQRMIRAWEVKTATGTSLRAWQRAPADAEAPALLTFIFLPPREALYAACERRFAAMVESGAIEEVRALIAMKLDPELPAMKAVGLREIATYLAGDIDRASMIALGELATRRYAKRQYTWFRHRLPDAIVMREQYSERLNRDIFTKVRESRLTL